MTSTTEDIQNIALKLFLLVKYLLKNEIPHGIRLLESVKEGQSLIADGDIYRIFCFRLEFSKANQNIYLVWKDVFGSYESYVCNPESNVVVYKVNNSSAKHYDTNNQMLNWLIHIHNTLADSSIGIEPIDRLLCDG